MSRCCALVFLFLVAAMSAVLGGCGQEKAPPVAPNESVKAAPEPTPKPAQAPPGEAGPSILNQERLGAGFPAGWSVSGSDYEWRPEPDGGPLGAGAAKVVLGQHSGVTASTPAWRVAPGQHFGVSFWCRGDGKGGCVKVAVLDNEGRNAVWGEQSIEPDAEWQQVFVPASPPEESCGYAYLELSVSGSQCTIWLDGLWVGPFHGLPPAEWNPPRLAGGVCLEPSAPWGLYVGEKPMTVKARVVGASEGSALHVHLVNTLGQQADLEPIHVSGMSETDVPIEHPVAKPFGMVRVEATLKDAGGKALSHQVETLLARAPEPVPGPLPDSYFGVHVLLREPDLAVAAKLGYKWCRIHDASGITKWGRVEPKQGEWDWHDEDIQLARKHGLRVLGMLDSAPPWESGDTRDGYFSIYGAPKNMDNWRNYVREAVTRYKGVVDDWEVWNEPWDAFRFFKGGSPDLYAQLLEAAYEEAKAANPDCTIVGIDTYPTFWEPAVLSTGAYPNYDILSFHRYDPSLHGHPGDAFAWMADRLARAQAPYGEPKPICMSEGGPDIGVFHGSFFSFAHPYYSGDWSRGADQYPRMFLSGRAAGLRYMIAYSIHNAHRMDHPTHMLVEPGWLLRPMHLSVAALAHFIDGAEYEQRLAPAHDVSAFVFRHSAARPFAEAGSTVVTLIANGEDPEALPRPLPEGIACYDRWGNPTEPPAEATRPIAYLVAEDAQREILLAALAPPPVEEAPPRYDVADLVDAAVKSLSGGGVPLWSLFSPQCATYICGDGMAAAVATRAELRATTSNSSPRLPADVKVASLVSAPAAMYTVGSARLSADGQIWQAVFSAIPDGPQGTLRFLSLAILPLDDGGAQDAGPMDVLGVWEEAMKKGDVNPLSATFSSGPCTVVAATPHGDNFVFNKGRYLVAMLVTAMLWGTPSESTVQPETVTVAGEAAAVYGTWSLKSFAFGGAPYAFSAGLVKEDGAWKLVSLCIGPSKARD